MANKKVNLLGENGLPNVKIVEIYKDALLHSYYHVCHIYSSEKQYNRDKTDEPFVEILNSIIEDKNRHITILHREIVNEYFDIEHWEFGLNSKKYYVAIKVGIKTAEDLFIRYKLQIIDC